MLAFLWGFWHGLHFSSLGKFKVCLQLEIMQIKLPYFHPYSSSWYMTGWNWFEKRCQRSTQRFVSEKQILSLLCFAKWRVAGAVRGLAHGLVKHLEFGWTVAKVHLWRALQSRKDPFLIQTPPKPALLHTFYSRARISDLIHLLFKRHTKTYLSVESECGACLQEEKFVPSRTVTFTWCNDLHA